MDAIHRVVGFAVVSLFALGWMWGLGAWLLRRDRGPGAAYWTWLAIAQVTAGAQAVLGIALLVVGRRVTAGSAVANVLHYVYGLLPLLLFAVAHVFARSGTLSALGVQRRDGSEVPLRPWTPFAWAAFISFGLTLRALMTGLGVS